MIDNHFISAIPPIEEQNLYMQICMCRGLAGVGHTNPTAAERVSLHIYMIRHMSMTYTYAHMHAGRSSVSLESANSTVVLRF